MLIKLVYLPKEPFWGLGDYLRGVFSCIGLCTEHNISWELDYRYHPISRFLENRHVTPDDYTLSDVTVFHMEDTKCLVHAFPQLGAMEDGVFYLTTNAWYLQNGIKETAKQRVRESLYPCVELQNGIQNILNHLGIQPRHFTALHVRLGDRYVVEGFTDTSEFEMLRNKILAEIYKETIQEPIVIVSDCQGFKTYLAELEGFLQSPSIPCHLSIADDTDAIFQTLCDFFLLGNASHIYQYSYRSYGTGFSDWCSELFSVPITRLSPTT